MFELPAEAGQGAGVLDPDRLQGPRVQVQQLEYRRGDLGGLDRLAVDADVPLAGYHDENRHVAVLPVVVAVLGDLALAAGVDDAVLGDAEDVGVPGIARWDIKEASRLAVGEDALEAGVG